MQHVAHMGRFRKLILNMLQTTLVQNKFLSK